MSIYGYCRVSTQKQKIERQESNIKALNPNAIIVIEKYTGTTQNRPVWNSLKRKVKAGDTIIFDEISRMSRTAAEGFEEYKMLYEKGVNLIFCKQRHLDTDCYRSALNNEISLTGTEVDVILEAVNKYLMMLAGKQIEIAFNEAQAEVDFLHQRISEGIAQAKLQGKSIGRIEGKTYTTKKSIKAKEIIMKHSKAFGGSLSDEEVMLIAGVSRNTFYKYKKELLNK